MHRSPATPVIVLCALALCVLLPGSALAGKKKSKKYRQAAQTAQNDVSADHDESDREHPGRGLGPGGVPALRDQLEALKRDVEQLAEDLEDSNEATRRALMRIGAQLEALKDADEETKQAIEGLAMAAQELSLKVEALDMEVEEVGTDVGALGERVAVLEEFATDDDEDGFSENLGDCDDTNADVNPLMAEVPGNGIDDDCDYAIDEMEMATEPMPMGSGEPAP